MQNKKVRAVGYKILFSTELNKGQIEDCIDNFLKEVDAKMAIARVNEMSEKEIWTEISSIIDN